MPDLLLNHPAANFDELVRVLKGEQAPRRVHHVEVGAGNTIANFVPLQNYAILLEEAHLRKCRTV